MSHPIFFLADLHLPSGESPFRDAFRSFLSGPAVAAEAVYILGDLFEFWVGDDYGLDVYYEETTALRDLHHAGVPVYFQHGNRDFLVGREFAELAEVTLLDEEHLLELGGEKVLIAHGDQFCTDDIGYQRWRAFSRNPEIQFLFHWLPRGLRERIGVGVRGRSNRAVKPAAITDVNDAEIRACFERTGADRIIHGHTHRPGQHEYDVGGRQRIRTVLHDWRDDRFEVLAYNNGSYRRVSLRRPSSD